MKEKLTTLADHLLPMLLASLAAAGFTFLQTFLAHSGICTPPEHQLIEASSLGAAFKGLHSIASIAKK